MMAKRLGEAISSICFAAPRCSDLPELMQVQMMFATKYGKEFAAAAADLYGFQDLVGPCTLLF